MICIWYFCLFHLEKNHHLTIFTFLKRTQNHDTLATVRNKTFFHVLSKINLNYLKLVFVFFIRSPWRYPHITYENTIITKYLSINKYKYSFGLCEIDTRSINHANLFKLYIKITSVFINFISLKRRIGKYSDIKLSWYLF